MVSIRDNFTPTDRTLGSCEHYVAMCVLCLGKSIDTSCDFSSPRVPSLWIVPPTLVGSLLHFWIERGAAGGSPVGVSPEKHHRRMENLLDLACVGPQRSKV
ncbi:Hypothetical predicted protein [Olea europaea subsp. europaea]|uniref:Uncharacterized protein n=1 Tax=Olea europaea subsp. europaea TaxID=158383 RepID=A0A8S0TXM7_OLEEU|nr:Hypothetical predicted protein [Olea europaea subsp. europaea]